MDTDGAVPDADDTPGTLMALHALASGDPHVRAAAERGVAWLLGLQNRDGGMPTFCRGWGRLPFDRSAPDITAHSLRAWARWRGQVDPALSHRMVRASERAMRYLARVQRADGSWVPLWFGNQAMVDSENPVYGTARVLQALVETGHACSSMALRGVQWLLSVQAEEGGWSGGPGGTPSIEETALAVEALTGWWGDGAGESGHGVQGAVARGVNWLMTRTEQGARFDAAPIGLYFAKLWYSEKLYPIVFTLSALSRARKAMGGMTEG
jgi:squalene-hopene/tetraprenyl-beta-curcumene cyclase